jgi:YesN/AraC family two-component response regulator
MDLQMPLMDGFTATKFLINEYKLKTPIIALSANAFKSEIDACMQIGMKDYVTKPFDEKTLISTIINNVKKSVSVKEKLDLPIVTEKPNGNKLYDLKVLEDISGGDKQFMQRMIEIFIEDSQESIKIIKEALNERNLDTIYRISHKIKPMIDSLGIYGLKNEVRELERLSKNGIDSVYIDQLIESVDVGICQVVEEMKGLLLNKSN